MTTKPIPIELSIVVGVWHSEFGGRIFMTPSTEDALNWIKTKAPQFGELVEPVEFRHQHLLMVNSTYKTEEVAEYLRNNYKCE